VIPQPLLAFEQRAKQDGDLQVLIALVSRRKYPRMAPDIASQSREFVQAVETAPPPCSVRSASFFSMAGVERI
jgi:hypothetical protein